MKKIIIIVVCLVIVIGGGLSYCVYASSASVKPRQITLSQNQITKHTKTFENFLSALQNNNYNEYNNVVIPSLRNEEIFSELKQDIPKRLGNFDNCKLQETIKYKDNDLLFYNCNFSKSKEALLKVAFNKENQINGIHLA